VSTGLDRLDWTLQHYSIDRLIASGHFGVVYHATHLPSGRDVALKLIPLQGQDSDEKVAAERHGAVLQQRFGRTHAGLVPEVFEHQTIVPFYAIAMELVKGQQLTALVAEGPMPGARAASIALAIAGFLEKAHQFETDIEGQHYGLIVHADLKPDHVLLLGDGSIRVLDFGIAKALAARTLVTTNKWGSMQYASPERLQSDGHVNEHADFWSLGVILFEMVAGYRPYRRYEHNPSLLDNAIRKREPRDPLPPATDAALAGIIQKLLSPQMERRYATAHAIAQDLHAYLRGEPTAGGLEHAQASQETVRLAPPGGAAPRRPGGVPTEPLPAAARPAPPADAAEPPAGRTAPPVRQSLATRTVRAVVLATGIAIMTSEGAALIRAEQLRAQVPAMEVSDLQRIRSEYRRIGAWTPIGIGRESVERAITGRMLELADRTIFEYRADAPALARAQWEQAEACLDFATELSPSNTTVAGKRAYVRGHLARIAERPDEAIRHFRNAARLTPSAPDPYLGLAVIYAYETRDVDAFNQAVEEAERRGYTRGRRVRVWTGDLHLTLGDRGRLAARSLRGPERIEQLERTAADYERCIESFEGLRMFNSEANLRTCRRRLADVTAELPPPPPPDSPFSTLPSIIEGVLRGL
jgi:serine/threonine-protein kinase